MNVNIFQLTDCCVHVLVTSFKNTILAECSEMIKSNETESKYHKLFFVALLNGLRFIAIFNYTIIVNLLMNNESSKRFYLVIGSNVLVHKIKMNLNENLKDFDGFDIYLVNNRRNS